jgi:hypothetical protein
MLGQASSLSIKNDGQDARRHQILLLFAITFENPYTMAGGVSGLECCSSGRSGCARHGFSHASGCGHENHVGKA